MVSFIEFAFMFKEALPSTYYLNNMLVIKKHIFIIIIQKGSQNSNLVNARFDCYCRGCRANLPTLKEMYSDPTVLRLRVPTNSTKNLQ